jgi:cholesterol oxidase
LVQIPPDLQRIKSYDLSIAQQWRDTTRLFIDISKGAKGQLGLIARGMLEIAPADFYVQMQTLKGMGGQDSADRLRAVAKFGRFFSRELFDTYGGVLARTGRYDV